ncbi:LacI family DNA-binding transcriptional regulator [Jejuia pallidilutea]|jgi:LacI family transcriptional regulator|uniref:LacI family transcriptional regulator n=1 Tax=Jejuia pallidilutea TaxID=504487 RepID=A0A090VZP9_9FLAO|nr:LacI family DNA-binding transcriptional regulator [Jejuia pallidilutea]GAL68719.1 LacI family transcriptional regulator [Jejuia pallidilutea]GAL72869.1 LacI family transcriptional regulator [Jejuia pallidilutea]GAL90305.1 LacI family transcriptional regulator [Jejuia pallidilutea]
MPKRITLKHIANTFGVSIATVSKALSDSYEISTSTKEKIVAYARANNYKSKSIDLSLLHKKTKTIGVIIPNIMNSFFAKVFVGIEAKANEHGYHLISCISNESYEKEVKTMELLKSDTLDGILISLAEETQVKQKYAHLKNAINEGVPVVMFDRVSEEINCDKVVVNDLEGAYHATKHLIQTGCKRVALISVIDNLSVGKLRVQGYKKALQEFKIPVEEKLIVRIGKHEDFDTVLKITLADKTIDGLLCLEESSAVNALQIIKHMQYNIPEDMSIACFTNGKMLQHLTPSISAISQHGKYIGETAAKLLIDRIENEDQNKPFETKVVKTSLIERQSTRKI